MRRTRYRFSHRSDDGLVYYWFSVLPIGPTESRYEMIRCLVRWFWAGEDCRDCKECRHCGRCSCCKNDELWGEDDD